MQFIGNSRYFVTAFAIALPSITVFTALLVFNLEMLLNTFSAFSEKSGYWLRQNMKSHRRRDWTARAIALQEDEAMTKAPVRRATKQSSGWIYTLFVLEFVFVTLPVSEIVMFLKYFRIHRNTSASSTINRRRSTTLTAIERGDNSVEPEAATRKWRNEMIKERIHQSVEEEKRKEQEKRDMERGALGASYVKLKRGAWAQSKVVLSALFTFFRALFVLLGILLLPLEYACVTVYLFLRPTRTGVSDKNSLVGLTISRQPCSQPAWKQAYELLGLDSIYCLGKKTPGCLNLEEIQTASRAATFLIPTSRGASSAGHNNSPYETELHDIKRSNTETTVTVC
jgi:hypothetical protein